MPTRWIADNAREDITRQVPASGTLVIEIGPPANQIWEVTQISLEMPTAPAGCVAELRDQMNALMSPSYSARRASASGSQILNPNEKIRAQWTGATPGDSGRVTALYKKGVFQ